MVVSRKARLAWSISGQGTASVATFGLNALLLRELTLAQFGSFGVTQAVLFFGVALVRSVTGEIATARLAGQSEAARYGSAVAIRIAGLAGIGGLGLGVLLQDSLMVAASLSLPMLVYYDAARWSAYATFAPQRGAVVDAVRLGLLSAALPPLLIFSAFIPLQLPALALLLYSATGFLAAAASDISSRRNVFGRCRVRSWWREHVRTAVPFAAEATAVGGLNALGNSLLLVIAGAQAAGTFRAAFVVLGPLTVLLQAGGAFLTPEARRQWTTGDRRRFARLMNRVTLMLGGAVMIYAAVLILLVPKDVRTFVFGTVGADDASIALGAMTLLASATVLVKQVALRVTDQQLTALRCRVAGSVLHQVGAVLGGVALAGRGALGLGAVGMIAAALISTLGLRRTLT